MNVLCDSYFSRGVRPCTCMYVCVYTHACFALIYIAVNEVIRPWIKVINKTVILGYFPYLMNEETTNWDGWATSARIHTQKLGLLISSHCVKAESKQKKRICGIQTFPKLPTSWRQIPQTPLLPPLQGRLVPDMEKSKAAFKSRLTAHSPNIYWHPHHEAQARLLTPRPHCLWDGEGHIP